MSVGQRAGLSRNMRPLLSVQRVERWVYCCAISNAFSRRSIQTASPTVSGRQIRTCTHHGGSKRNSTQNTRIMTMAPRPRMTNTAGPSPASLPRRSRSHTAQRSTTRQQAAEQPAAAAARAGAAQGDLDGRLPRPVRHPALSKGEPPGIARRFQTIVAWRCLSAGRSAPCRRPTSRCRRTGTATPRRRSASTRRPPRSRNAGSA